MPALKRLTSLGGDSAGRKATEGKPVCLAEHRALRDSSAAVHLDQLSAFDMVTVTTRTSVYEIIVLQGQSGDVLVRGGSQFPEFCQVRFVGSTAGGSALKLLTIDVDLQMEFRVSRSIVVTTSTVQTVCVRCLDHGTQARA